MHQLRDRFKMRNTLKSQVGTNIFQTMDGHPRCDYNGHVNGYSDQNGYDVVHMNGDVGSKVHRCVTDRCNIITQYSRIPNGYDDQMNCDTEHANILAETTQDMSVIAQQDDQVISIRAQSNGHLDHDCETYDLCERISSVDMEDSNEREIYQKRQAPACHYVFVDQQSSVAHHWPEETLLVQDNDGDTYLHIGLILQELNLVITLINAALSPRSLSTRNNLFQTPLHLAILTNQIAAVRRLVIGGAEIDSRDRNGNTPLHLAVQRGLTDIAATLMEPVRYHETKLNVNYEIPYQKIPQNLEIANYEGKNVLQLAAEGGHEDIVKMLIEKRADVNSRDGKTGRTILHNACLEGNVDLVRYLLSIKETNINSKSYDEYTPFDFARIRGHTEIAIILAKAGARNRDDDEFSD